MVEQQPNDHPHIQDLFSWAKKARRLGVGDVGLKIDRPFIPDQEIKAYFKDIRQTRKLLAALYPPDGNPQLDAETIREKYPKVFLILLLTGNGRRISHFVCHDSLCDQKLPFRTSLNFPHTPNDDFFTSFCHQQWEFCAQIFDYRPDQQFDGKDLILPIISIEKLGGGGSATVHKIGLHPAYNRLGRNRLPQNGLTRGDAHTFVLKTYNTPDAEDYYRSEVNGFLNPNVRGESTTNIIGFHGSFIWHGTYNVLLEYADRGTLEQYFDTAQSPSSGEGITNVWRELCKLLPALDAIQGGQPSDSTTASRFQGWHQDIKPSNILVKSKEGGSPCDVEFKIADLGVSHFKRHVASQGEATDRDSFGTRAYGAPECYRAEGDIERARFLVNRNVDNWSLGCVFSEAAVWLVYGKAQLAEYRRRRGEETKKIYGFRDGDCFHDGQQVLTTVTKIHKTLAADIRFSDHVTRPILHMVTNEMLVGSKNRTPANFLSFRTQRILKEADIQLRGSASNAVTGRVSRRAVQSRPRTPPQLPPGHREPRLSNSYGQRLPSHDHAGTPVDTSYNEGENNPQEYINGHFPARYSDQSTRPQSTGLINQDQFSDTHLNFAVSDGTLSQDSPDGPRWQEPLSPNSRRRRISADLVSAAINRNSSDISNQNRQETENFSRRNGFTASPEEISRTNTTTLIQEPYDGPRRSQNQSRFASGARPARLASNGLLSNIHPSLGIQASQRPPVLSFSDAERWKRDKKEHRVAILPGDHLLADLDKRDHVFLIDNSLSMKPHSGEVRDLFALLGYMVKSKDPDGIELHFTKSSERKDKAKNTGQLLRTLDTVSYFGKSNIRLQLGEILQDYHTKLRDQNLPRSMFDMVRPRRRARRQTVYIFTDGVWQPECDPSEMIEKLVKSLEQNHMEREQFGIQFIRFGNVLEGKNRLDRLDSGLGLSMDVVDTEPSTGNVYKMLFGANNNWYDGDNVNSDKSAFAPPPPRVVDIT